MTGKEHGTTEYNMKDIIANCWSDIFENQGRRTT